MNRDEVRNELLEAGYEEDVVDKLTDTVLSEFEEEESSGETLLETLKKGVDSVMNKLDPKNFSWVKRPSHPSMFVMTKSDEKNYYETYAPIIKSFDDDWKVIYGAVMVPNVKDRDGEVITGKAVKESAWKYMKNSKTDAVDQEHRQIEGKGQVVETWLLKEPTEFELNNGKTVKYPANTWMAGVMPTEEVKEDIKNGDVKGFSIYGMADEVRLKSVIKNSFNNKKEVNDMTDKTEDKETQETEVKEEETEEETEEKEIQEEKETKEEIKEADLTEFKNEMKEEMKGLKEEILNAVDEVLNREIEEEEEEEEDEDEEEDEVEEQVIEENEKDTEKNKVSKGESVRQSLMNVSGGKRPSWAKAFKKKFNGGE